MAEYRYPLCDEIKKVAENAINEVIKNKFVPVVRCGDCKHFSPLKKGDGFCNVTNLRYRYDWYCADGERKDNA